MDNGLNENFKDILSSIGDDLKQSALDSVNMGVYKTDYLANIKRVHEYVSDWPSIYNKAIKKIDNINENINTLNTSGYDKNTFGNIFDSLDQLMFVLLGDELDRDIKARKYLNIQRIGSSASAANTVYNAPTTSQTPNLTNDFKYVYNRMNVISTYNVQSGVYTNFKSSVSNDPLFETAWKNVIDNRTDTQNLYDLFRTIILMFIYEKNDLSGLMSSPSSVKAYIDSLNSPTMLVSSISQELLLDPAHPTSIISQFDPNIAFASMNLKNNLIGALRGQYTSSDGLDWLTDVKDNVKIMAWMLNIVYNLIGSNRMTSFLR